MGKYFFKLVFCNIDCLVIWAVNHKNESLAFVVVVVPHLAESLLASNVPYHEFEGLIMEFFDVKTDSREGMYDFAQLQGIQDGGFAGPI